MRTGTDPSGTRFVLMDAGEIGEAARGNRKWMDFQQNLHDHMPELEEFHELAALGSNSYVKQSEEFLATLEGHMPLTKAWETVDDVVGAVPNVPAFLAGHPQSMRRRQRTTNEHAPICLLADVGSSMGISAHNVLKRGITLLAFVQCLVRIRSVELWIGTSLHTGHQRGVAAWRIDTAPLDLARAAFHIADPSMSRMFGYAMCEQLHDKHLYDRIPNSEIVKTFQYANGIPDVVYLPGIRLDDPMVTDPINWIKRELAKYTHKEDE